MTFLLSSLITPERANSDPIEAFSIVPHWARSWQIEGLAEHDPVIFVVVGEAHRYPIIFCPLGFALACEVTRFGHGVTTNSNFAKNPRIYVKVMFSEATKDYVTLGRVIAGATANEAVKALENAKDFRAENLYRIGAGKPEKAARDLVLRHCERLAIQRQKEGTLSQTYDVEAYLNNIARLFAAIDAELEALTKGAAA